MPDDDDLLRELAAVLHGPVALSDAGAAPRPYDAIGLRSLEHELAALVEDTLLAAPAGAVRGEGERVGDLPLAEPGHRGARRRPRPDPRLVGQLDPPDALQLEVVVGDEVDLGRGRRARALRGRRTAVRLAPAPGVEPERQDLVAQDLIEPAAPERPPLELARSALASVQSSPGLALELAARAGEEAVARTTPRPARRPSAPPGWPSRRRAGSTRRCARCERARSVALRARLDGCAALAAMSLAVVLFDAGRSARALRYCRLAEPHLTGLDAARLATQRGLILGRLGGTEEALACFARAAPVLEPPRRRACGAPACTTTVASSSPTAAPWPAPRTTSSARWSCTGGSGPPCSRPDAAQPRLRRRAARRRPGRARAVRRRRRRLRRGLRRAPQRAARRPLRGAARRRAVGEARDAAAAAVAELEQRGIVADLAEARLMLAQAALRDDDPSRGGSPGRARLRRPSSPRVATPWAALARHAGLEAALGGGRAQRRPAPAGEPTPPATWPAPAGPIAALDAWLIVARMLLETGRAAARRAAAGVARGPPARLRRAAGAGLAPRGAAPPRAR